MRTGIAAAFAVILGATALDTITTAQAQSADPAGTWSRPSGTSRLRIARCGQAYCGTIAWLRDPNGPDGKPMSDAQNPDPSRRTRPLLGTAVIIGMAPTGKDGQWKGQVYKADEGKTYTGYMTLQGARQLKLEGCVLGGMVCKAETLTRAD